MDDIWNCFRSNKGLDGFKFQDFCYEIIKEELSDLNIEKRNTHAKNGPDGGKDIILYKNINNRKVQYAIIECKARDNNNATLNIGELFKPIFTVMNEKVEKLIYITNHQLNNNVITQFENISNDDHWPFDIFWIEGEHLASIIQKYPSIYKEFCKTDFNFKTNNNFINLKDFIRISNDNKKITLSNFDFKEKEIKIKIDNKDISIILTPFSNHSFSIPSIKKELDIVINTNGTILTKSIINHRYCMPIDYLYVDPYDYTSTIINYKGVVYISGNAGTGKSRLLNEIYKIEPESTIKIDLSSFDYQYTFLEHLLEKIFHIQYLDIINMSDQVIYEYLNKNNIPKDCINLLINSLKSTNKNENSSNYNLKIEAISEIALTFLRDKRLIIDNIHKFSPTDTLLLQAIINKNISTNIVLSARGNEIESSDLEEYISLLSDKIMILDLKNCTNTILNDFIDKVSINKYTIYFLKKNRFVDNIQEFMLFLKKLKSENLLIQKDNGQVEINKHIKQTKFDYTNLFKTIISNIEKKIDNKLVIEIIKSAAVYGYTFPVKYLESRFNENIEDIIDILIYYELFKESDIRIENQQWLKFDHELTHEIAYISLLPRKLKKEHKEVLSYIIDSTYYIKGKDDGVLAYHYEAVQNYTNAIKSYYKHSKYLLNIGQLKDSVEPLELAFRLFAYIKENKTLLNIQAEIIDQTIEIYMTIGISKDKILKKLDVLQIHIMLYKNIIKKKFGIKSEFYNVLFFHNDNYKISLIKIIDELKLIKEYREILNVRRILVNKLKEDTKYDEAKKESLIAINEAKLNIAYKDMLSEAYLYYGGVFLENYEYKETVKLWDMAVEELEGTLYTGKLCFAMIDRAYIYALVYPDNYKTRSYLSTSLAISKRYNLKREELRGIINYMNWLYYHTEYNKEELIDLVNSAENLAQELNNEYLLILVDFSKINFNILDETSYNKSYNRLMNYMEKYNPTTNIGDLRIKNILCWMSKKSNKKISDNCNNIYKKGEKYAVYF